MRLFCCLVLGLLLVACSSIQDSPYLEAQAVDPLPWQVPSYFASLTAGSTAEDDYYRSPSGLVELVSSYNPGNDPRCVGCGVPGDYNLAPINARLIDFISTIPNVPGLKLVNTYTLSVIQNISPTTPVCGQILVRFSFRTPPSASQTDIRNATRRAIRRIVDASEQFFGAGQLALYGISPRASTRTSPGGSAATSKLAESQSGLSFSQSSSSTSTLSTELLGVGSTVLPALTEDYSKEWAYSAVNALPGTRADGVRVAVIDTGVSEIPGEFFLDVAASKNFVAGQDPFDAGDVFLRTDNGVTTNVGHGTGVAALIASESLGIASGAMIVAVKTCDELGSCDDIALTQGVCYGGSDNANAQVLNLSLGSLLSSPTGLQAVREVVASGRVVVAAAGNSNAYAPPRKNLPNFPAFRAPSVKGLISVGAIDANIQYADFGTAYTKNSVEMIAPGADLQQGLALPDATGILTYDPSGNLLYMEGTSFAAPFVTGAAASLVAQCPNVPFLEGSGPAWVEQHIKQTTQLIIYYAVNAAGEALPLDFRSRLLNVDGALTTAACP
jgi:hypothetical protein